MRGLAPLLLALTTCVAQQGGESGERASASPAETVESGPSCATAGEDALAILPAAGPDACPVAVELASGLLELRALDPLEGEDQSEDQSDAREALAVGPGPADCGEGLAGCELFGVLSERGPILLASQRGHESEVPVQVHLGWVVDGQLRFARSWHGPDSVVDHTRVGPPWALAPFDCDGRIALLPAPRLPEAEVEEPSAELLAHAGVWSVAAEDDEPEATPPSEPGTLDPSECRALLDALP